MIYIDCRYLLLWHILYFSCSIIWHNQYSDLFMKKNFAQHLKPWTFCLYSLSLLTLLVGVLKYKFRLDIFLTVKHTRLIRQRLNYDALVKRSSLLRVENVIWVFHLLVLDDLVRADVGIRIRTGFHRIFLELNTPVLFAESDGSYCSILCEAMLIIGM